MMKFIIIVLVFVIFSGCEDKAYTRNTSRILNEEKVLMKYNISMIDLRNILESKRKEDPFLRPEKYNPGVILALSGIPLKGASVGMDYSTNTLIVEAAPATHKKIQLLIGREPLQ